MKREGSLKHCPVCQTALPVPKEIYGETRCPRCSCQLWLLTVASGPAFFVRRPGETVYDLLAALASSRQEITATQLERTLRDADSFDVTEFLSELGDVVRS